MKHFHDREAYERREMRVAEEIVRSIMVPLRQAGFRGDKLKTLTEDIASSVSCAVDGSAHMDIDDDHIVPILGFAEGRRRDRLLLPEGGSGSSLHEYVFGISKQLLADESA